MGINAPALVFSFKTFKTRMKDGLWMPDPLLTVISFKAVLSIWTNHKKFLNIWDMFDLQVL